MNYMLPSWVYSLAEEVLEKSIEYPTILGEAYRDIVEYYAEVLSNYGVHTTIHRVPDDYLRKYLDKSMNPDKPRYILIARIGSGEKVLQYNGHYDIVAPGKGWTITEPFKPKKIDNRLYGRGSTDMKGGLAAFTVAIAYLASTKEPMDHVVEVAYVPDEEIGGLTGTGYLVNELGSRPNWVVIGEPSGLGTIWIGHKGGIWLDVIVKGKQAHASTPWHGENAFEKMIYIAKYLVENVKPIIESRISRYEYDEEESKKATMVLGGKISAPGSPNIVPGEVSFSIDRRLIIEENLDQAEEELKKYIMEAASLAKARVEINVLTRLSPSFVSPNSKLINTLSEIAYRVLGFKPRKVVCTGGLDLHYYTDVGVMAISYGPGKPSQAHTINEYIELNDLYRSIDIYVELSKKAFK